MRALQKLRVIVLILVVLVVAGCTEINDIVIEPTQEIPAETPSTESENITEEIPDETVIEDFVPEGSPELRIMSTSRTDNVLHIRVINSGDALAEDVFCGIVGVEYNWNYRPDDFPNRAQAFETLAYDALMNENNTSFYNAGLAKYDSPYPQDYEGSGSLRELTMEGELKYRYYLGDMEPGEIKEAEMTVSPFYYDYIKIAWTEDKELFVVY